MGEYALADSDLSAAGLRVGIAVARFNEVITAELLAGCRRELARRGAAADDVTVCWVPGAFELPLTAQRLARSGRVDAVVCLGAIVRGETAHFDYVAMGATQGILQAGLDTGVPVVFGVLTVDTQQQALDRIGGREGHKGEEAALTAIEMARLFETLRVAF
jgi:6,7-dimethyl-8-ribityllumazine synthase